MITNGIGTPPRLPDAQRPQPLEALAGAEPLRRIARDIPCGAAIEQQAAQRDDERLQPKAADQQSVHGAKAGAQRDDGRQREAGGQCHSTSIIDSSTPSSAQIDPTDRSMPPVMITMPTPMLKMPYMPTSRATFWRLATLRNCGLAGDHGAQHDEQQENADIFSGHVEVPPASRDGQPHDRLGRAVGARQDTGDAAVVHHRDAVAFARRSPPCRC